MPVSKRCRLLHVCHEDVAEIKARKTSRSCSWLPVALLQRGASRSTKVGNGKYSASAWRDLPTVPYLLAVDSRLSNPKQLSPCISFSCSFIHSFLSFIIFLLFLLLLFFPPAIHDPRVRNRVLVANWGRTLWQSFARTQKLPVKMKGKKSVFPLPLRRISTCLCLGAYVLPGT